MGVIDDVIPWCFKFVQLNKRQDEELKAIRKEQALICYGCLLKKQSCNGPVTEAMNRMEGHLNQRHRGYSPDLKT